MSGLEADETHAAALAGLPGMNPRRLVRLLDGFTPVLAWQAVAAGAHPGDPDRRFGPAARRTDVREVAERHVELGVRVLLPGCHGYPSALVGDPGAPAVLFALGDPMRLEGKPRVAIVGTRSATHYGRRVAAELAGSLTADGVSVVSGLASGIDAAAHAGALRATCSDPAPPIAVVGTGPDVIYPSSNRELWGLVTRRGVLFTEAALGTQPHRGVFPARNRMIAALSDVVVVVESHRRGGAIYTVEAAVRRSIPVCAVPGSVHSRASDGTNALLADGCAPVRDADDVLTALSLVRAGKGLPRIRTSRITTADSRTRSSADRSGGNRSERLTELQQVLLEAVDDTPTAFETILIRTDLSIAAVAEACDQLVERGILRSGAGWWSTT
jgi:DNA processing protein